MTSLDCTSYVGIVGKPFVLAAHKDPAVLVSRLFPIMQRSARSGCTARDGTYMATPTHRVTSGSRKAILPVRTGSTKYYVRVIEYQWLDPAVASASSFNPDPTACCPVPGLDLRRLGMYIYLCLLFVFSFQKRIVLPLPFLCFPRDGYSIYSVPVRSMLLA
jgi:hypothetical protein